MTDHGLQPRDNPVCNYTSAVPVTTRRCTCTWTPSAPQKKLRLPGGRCTRSIPNTSLLRSPGGFCADLQGPCLCTPDLLGAVLSSKLLAKREFWNIIPANISSFARVPDISEVYHFDGLCVQEFWGASDVAMSIGNSIGKPQKHAVINPSNVTEASGCSAGTAVIVGWPCDVRRPPFLRAQFPPPERFCMSFWSAVALGGVVLVSL